MGRLVTVSGVKMKNLFPEDFNLNTSGIKKINNDYRFDLDDSDITRYIEKAELDKLNAQFETIQADINQKLKKDQKNDSNNTDKIAAAGVGYFIYSEVKEEKRRKRLENCIEDNCSPMGSEEYDDCQMDCKTRHPPATLLGNLKQNGPLGLLGFGPGGFFGGGQDAVMVRVSSIVSSVICIMLILLIASQG